MLNQIKNVALDRMDFDETVALFAFGTQLEGTYTAMSLEAPDWLKANIEILRKDIVSKRRDNLERALKAAKTKLDGLKTAEEKRGDLKAEIDRISAALGS
jgi:hypothetical protein